jgi:ribosome-associated translation inhibitor RaiA
MTIDIQGIPTNPGLRARVTKQISAALAELSVKPVGAQATFFDENGPKGGIAVRCALTVRLPYRPSVRVEHVAETARLAFDESFETLRRQLVRYRERARVLRRRPKKYYAAKRVTEE